MKQKHTSAAVKMLVLIITNIFTAAFLLLVLARQHYFDRITNRFIAHNTAPYRYTDNLYYSERADLQQLYNAPAKIVLLGTSLTYKAHWNEMLQRCDISNQGVSSDITSGLLSRLPAVYKCHPQICFIEGGANDPGHGVAIEETVSNLRKIILALQHRHITPVITTIPFMCATSERRKVLNIRIFVINVLIRKMAAELHCGLTDLNRLLADGMALNPAFAAPDGSHLSSKGYIIWKNAVADELKQQGIE